MSKKTLVNLSLDFDYVEALKEQAKEKNFEKVSDYIKDWLIKLSLERKDTKRVILQIPPDALKDKNMLYHWLNNKNNDIVDHYFKETDAE